MKKIFTLTSAFAFALCAMSQQKVTVANQPQRAVYPRSASETEIAVALDKGRASLEAMANVNRGGGVFSEDFSNGLAGQNGAWTAQDSGGGTIWMMADANSPAGAYSDPAEALESTTAANGWVIFDCDLYQGGEISANNPAEDVSGYLTSPEIDFTAMSSVILEFQQAFRYCCFDALPLFVEVTNDGTNWVVFNAAPEFTGGANDASANPLVTTLDISGVAAGEGAVRIRFGWQANGNSTHSHYFWGIDDITTYENPVANDVEVSYVSNGDIFNDFEYRCIALEQAIPSADGGLTIGTIFQNIGTVSQVATVTVEVLDASQNVIATATDNLTIPSNSELENPGDPIDTLFVQTGWEPTVSGQYYARTTISYAGTDETPENNTMIRSFLVADGEYGQDDPALINGQMDPFTPATGDPFSPVGYGNYLSMFNDGSIAGGVSIRFDNSTDDNCPIVIQLLKQNTDYNLTDADYIGYEEYIVQPSFVPTGNSAQFPIYLPFEDVVDLEAGSRYFVCVQTDSETDEQLSVKAIAEDDVDFSTGIWAETTEGDFIWFFGLGGTTDFSPAVRLILYEFIGTEEESKVIESFTVSPNPASTEARISFGLIAASYVAYEVRDMSGKLVEFANIGQFNQGTNSYALNVSDYAAGNYVVNLVLDGSKVISRQISVVK